MGRQNLRYRYMYAESTEILFVESTYILEHILRLVSRIQEHTDTKLCSYPVHSLASLWTAQTYFFYSKSSRKTRILSSSGDDPFFFVSGSSSNFMHEVYNFFFTSSVFQFGARFIQDSRRIFVNKLHDYFDRLAILTLSRVNRSNNVGFSLQPLSRE